MFLALILSLTLGWLLNLFYLHRLNHSRTSIIGLVCVFGVGRNVWSVHFGRSFHILGINNVVGYSLFSLTNLGASHLSPMADRWYRKWCIIWLSHSHTNLIKSTPNNSMFKLTEKHYLVVPHIAGRLCRRFFKLGRYRADLVQNLQKKRSFRS